jgi:glycosyltransferase involved in cell wall biosynthesis
VKVVVFGTYDVRVHPRGAVLIEGLAEHGFDIVEVNERLELGTAERVGMLQHPTQLPRLLGRLARCWVTLLSRSRSAGRADAVLVPYLGHFDVLLARLRWPRRIVVLDHLVSAAATAQDRGERSGSKLRLLSWLDSLATGMADVIVVDTEESAAVLPLRSRARAVVVPVGATREWFAAGEARDNGRRPGPLRVIFFGSFTPLQGTAVIARALALLGEDTLAVTLLGTGQDHDEVRRTLLDRRDITWRDWVPIEELPALVADHDVCLGIFGDTEKALRVVPTKIYQGAAAGCALVTSDTVPHRLALGDAALLVPPGDHAALAGALAALAGSPEELARLRAAAIRRATAYAPLPVVRPLAELLSGLVSQRRSHSASGPRALADTGRS